MSDLCVFSTGVKPLLRESCARFRVELHEYGMGRPWPGLCQGKIAEALEFLNTRREQYALFTDGEDSFIASYAPTIIGKFQTVNPAGSILISAEKYCYPHPDLSQAYPPSPTPWKYLNSGGWMGSRKRLIQVLSEMLHSHWFGVRDDQYCWTQFYIENNDAMAIDHQCEIFQTLSGMNLEYELRGDIVENVITGTFPSVFHANGRSATIEQLRELYQRAA